MPRTTRVRADAGPATTSQRLGSVIKSARDIMRKDKGLNGDLDRLPMLAWIMFLKFLDDAEGVRETEAQIQRTRFVPAIEAPYRWRDWAAPDDGTTGDALIAFITNERATRPDGTEGPGLFAHLRGLQGTDGGDRRDVIATVFHGTFNRMINGYLLRDVINCVDEIHFASSDEIHTLGALYETMLREMRDAAGDSGEFYTPRPVVRFLVEATDPQLGETVLDPACGTGGFLVDAYLHLLAQAQTVQDAGTLARSIRGGEAKPLPYLLAQVNLILHGIESPDIQPGNSLGVRLSSIGDRDRVDVILTNPPFGGEEERGIRANFPAELQTAETALLFLQLIMRLLRRRPKAGRAGVVVPNTTLFYPGVAARVRRQLLTECNLYAVVRLPKGVFEPYTDIETNLLLFGASGPSTEILYYRLDPPEGRKQYTKTRPLRQEDLAECLDLVRRRSSDSPNAWTMDAAEILADDMCVLDRHNPKDLRADVDPPAAVLSKLEAATVGAQSRLAAAEEPLRRLLDATSAREEWVEIPLGRVLTRQRDVVEVENEQLYKRLRIQVKGRGVVLRDELRGARIGTKRQFRVRAGQFVLSKIDARNGAFGVVPEECDGAIITGNFWAYDVDDSALRPRLLNLLTQSDAFIDFCVKASPGATNRRYLQEERFLEQRAYVPEALCDQDELCDLLEKIGLVSRFGEVALPLLGTQFPLLLRSSLDLVFRLPLPE